MDFKQIEAFINVAKFKSFSKAANACFLSQPAISSHISSLEKQLKIQLFDRTSKEVLLTPAGSSFLNYAIDILNARDKAISNLAKFNETVSGKLKLASSTTPCNTIVPILIKNFHTLYPEVSFDVMERSSREIIENIIKFDCELGIIGELVNDEKIKSYKLIEDDLIVISAPEFNLPSSIKIEELLKYPFVLREEGSATRKTFEDALQKQGFDTSNMEICFEVNNLDSLLQFVRQGLGISVVSSQVFRDYISYGLIKETAIENLYLKRYIYLILSSKRTLTPTSKAFFNLCKNHFKFD
ncbi:LysR family transcriptional regulator [Clostridium carboxidivorans P7]|uniref:Transcriptional regulator, LysR family n=1 Tax=Clostridium carboxidivorans P7 TaxID=536227 RepID=C6PQ84_9CLOT|nr:selenium metabolism-associated LysR family transcriptional regulator [Clostridium carboxidivorans]AKN33082.1 LysR family transcriptional regulator [Clostridium carboxidivorans P7]EET88554.1 transcriptional regulator, LysR family [Clostridium carboxidivorans P7]EFG87995.1 LysR substrate binding domain protein [Clostridium carboxidivorans P7]